MYRPFSALASFTKLAIFSMSLVCASTQATTDDFKQLIKVDSKFNFVDGKKKTSIFRENVHITQGSLTIDADEVEVLASEGKGKEVFVAKGAPAKYQQTLDDGSNIRALANEIHYQVSNRILTLRGSAELHQNNSMVKGKSIVFNMELEQLLAQGSDENDGRVITIFQPDNTQNTYVEAPISSEEDK